MPLRLGGSLKLLLFDIDGTLMHCGRQVGLVFLEAMKEVFGPLGDVRGHSFAGKTDPSIILEIVRNLGLHEDEIVRLLPEVQSRYLPRLEETLDVKGMELLPGVRPLLARLAEKEDVAVGLLTGNWEGGARVKLSRFELNPFFDFGAFGDDGVDRCDLPPVALERAREHCLLDFSPEDVLIIGDTIRDVECGLAHGLKVLGVTTGRTGEDELRRAGAHWVTSSLEAVDAVPHLN